MFSIFVSAVSIQQWALLKGLLTDIYCQPGTHWPAYTENSVGGVSQSLELAWWEITRCVFVVGIIMLCLCLSLTCFFALYLPEAATHVWPTWIWVHWRAWSHLLAHKSGLDRPGLALTNQNLKTNKKGGHPVTSNTRARLSTSWPRLTTLCVWQPACAYLRSWRRAVCRSWSDFSAATSVCPVWRQWGSTAVKRSKQGVETLTQLSPTELNHIWIKTEGTKASFPLEPTQLDF